MTSRRRISNMFISQRKLQVLASLATVFSLLSATSCTGFFQNPVLSTVTVGPASLNLNQGATQQMTATGTYNDGSTKNLTTGVVWTSSDTTVATISNSGVVTGIDVGSATITGESGTTSGTAAVTVVLANVTAITVSPTTTTVRINGGTTVPFTASATVSGSSTPVDVTSTVTWAISTTSVGTTADFTVQGQGTDSITILANSTAVAGEVATLTATYISSTSTIVANATITATN
jgi:uncharacterized protein YjdB